MKEFIAPIITGLITGITILLFQHVLTPFMDKNSLIKKEQWISKRDSFITALELVDRRFDAVDLDDGKGEIIHKASGKKIEAEEINKCVIKLILLSDNNKIPRKFNDFFTHRFTFTDRGEFISLLRKELFNSAIKIKPDEVPIFLENKSETNKVNGSI
ncbi:MAG: hypothetical protein KJ710_03245 [Candidatus Omnitrophica bacterium]|nr:hypothetical protein [Candidatus Omnitrophota bacterium]MBU1923266.1 hypothetical protein [Candidatus Omnitrophota bacterium]